MTHFIMPIHNVAAEVAIELPCAVEQRSIGLATHTP